MKAFPSEYSPEGCMSSIKTSGMDLRDYFAAKAMTVLIADYLKDMDWETDNPYEHFNCAIEVSYKIADAMMKARKQ